MIWLTWRQARLESLIGVGALAFTFAFLLWTGLDMHDSYDAAGLPSCAAITGGDEGCANAADAFLNRFRDLDNMTAWLNLLPFLLGLLLAAPTVLDLEQGTYRLAWTQSVTRNRWLATKIGFGTVVAAGVATALVALWTWWRGPFDAIEGRFNGNSFDFEGTVAIAYTVFAFALCLSIGALLRRAIPTVGIGLVAFLVARLGVADQLRPNYLDPVRVTWDPLESPPAAVTSHYFGSGDWIFEQGMGVTSAAGAAPFDDSVIRSCLNAAPAVNGKVMIGGAGNDAVNQCFHDHGVFYSLVYHPADRFWTFQAIETALFLGVAAVLLAVTAWWVTRRIV